MSPSSPIPLKVAIVGGSSGFIVNAHQKAIFMDGTRKVVAAALSSNPERALQTAASWPYPIKGYKSFDAMVNREIGKSEEDRIDYVVILTPDHAHFEPAKRFLEAGIPVFCEKPLTDNLSDSEALKTIVNEKTNPILRSPYLFGTLDQSFGPIYRTKWIAGGGSLVGYELPSVACGGPVHEARV